MAPDRGQPSVLMTFLDTVTTYSWFIGLQAIILLCLTTRLGAYFNSLYRPADTDSSSIPRLPHWLPYIGHQIQFKVSSQTWLFDNSQKLKSDAFVVHLLGRDYITITAPVLLLSLSESSSTNAQKYSQRRTKLFFAHPRPTFATTTRTTTALQNHRSASLANSKALKTLVSTHSPNLISPATSWVDQSPWERQSSASPLPSASTAKSLAVSANLPALLTSFSTSILLSTLLGQSFIDANPDFPTDFHAFTAKYASFMTGVPYWIAPGLGPPAFSRERCLRALDGLVRVVVGGSAGGADGMGVLYDADEVHGALRDLMVAAMEKGEKVRSVRGVSCEVLEVVWNIVFEAVNLTVWMMVYLYLEGEEHARLLEAVRQEVKTVCSVEKMPASGLAFEEPPRLVFRDNEKDIVEKCPVMKGCLMEVMRLETEREGWLEMEKDFVLTGKSDEKTQTSYRLVKGDRIYAAYGATSRDSRTWDRPRRFNPKRFEGVAVERPQTMLLTGRLYGTAEVMYIVAALVSFYNFKSLGDETGLNHPGSRMITGIGVPKDGMKAKVSRIDI